MTTTFDSKATLETILNHRSIRKFRDQPIDPTTFEFVNTAAMAGSSSGFAVCQYHSVTEPAPSR